jgi:hypothetical protein
VEVEVRAVKNEASSRSGLVLGFLAVGGLGLALGSSGCHRSGPAVIEEGEASPVMLPPPALEAGRDKGRRLYVAGNPVPPSFGRGPSAEDAPMTSPYSHDGARIERSLTTGVTGSDHGP